MKQFAFSSAANDRSAPSEYHHLGCAFYAQHPDAKIGIEEAKLLAKQIAEALKEAGLQIAAADPASAPT